MDDDNNDAPRVTRARTRRLSVLDTDSRPLTPMLDVAADRASPRPMRRTRLNSATVDLRTPTRATRLSVARGETPEPATPTVTLSSVKRGTRTPAKSVRKQLPLPEDVNEEESNTKMQVQTKAEPDNEKMNVVTEDSKAAVVDSRPMQTQFGTPPDERRVTRSMSKTPPVIGRAVNNTPQQEFDTKNSPEGKKKQTMQSIEIATEIVDSPVEAQQSMHSDESVTKESVTTTKVGDKSTLKATPKVKVKVKDILIGNQEDMSKVDNVIIVSNVDVAKNDDQVGIIAEPIEDKEEIKQSAEITDKPFSTDGNISMKQRDVPPKSDDTCTHAHVIEDVRLPDLTPNIKTRLVEQKRSGPMKSVGFNNNGQVDEPIKQKYPKTPARVSTPAGDVYSLAGRKANSEVRDKSETPLKPIILKGRNSSTPLTKLEPLLSQANGSNEQNPPPPQIDMIKPLSALEDKEENVQTAKETPTRRLVSEDEDEEEDEYEESPVCEFFANEVEVINNYQSGDSMDSSVRHEIEENEIPHDGESVGSQDTVDDDSDDSADEKMSFIVSDNEVDDNDIESLCFSSASEEADMEPKKRRRIIVHDSSADEDPEENKEIKINDSTEEDKPAEKSIQMDENESDMNREGQLAVEQADKISTCDKSPELKPNDNNDIESLCFSSASEEADMEPKKRRRIIVHDSSADEDPEENKEIKKNDSTEEEKLTEKSIQMDENESDMNREAGQLTVEQADKISTCEKSPELKPNNSDPPNKTAPQIGINLGEEFQKDADLSVEELLSSSNESDEHEVKKNTSRSIYEVLDSGEESSEDKEYVCDKPTPEDNETTREDEKSNSNEKLANFHESPIVKEEKPISNEEKQEVVVKSVVPISESSSFHAKQKREEEAALLGELSSCDLSHLRQMFNPLQKSRRQTLYVQDPHKAPKEPKPKLKRRSEQLNSDVKPSQSFIETLAEEKIQLMKRKRMSKSFCGAVDGLDTSVLSEMQNKKAKFGESAASDNEMGVAVEAVKEELPTPAPMSEAKAKDELSVEKVVQPKSRNDYIEYCDTLIRAANEAKLEEKKKRIAAGKKQKSRLYAATLSTCIADPANGPSVAAAATKSVSEKPTKIKKDVKRLQATKQAIKRAMQLLAPDAANKEPQSLARKLSPQPDINAKPAKSKQQTKTKTKKKKPTVVQKSPVKSSDEENHHIPKRIKTSAGYVTVMSKKERRRIETFKTSSSIVEVEPCTPTQKYFKEVLASPKTRHGFKEMPATPKTSKKKSTAVRNPATEAALRFKREIFGSSYK
ncbi:protein slender lobes-like [Drosophila virilis]|uniref:protein slender lobes-like n=1 Tax=Drosophila virilis TaxID=7244 RepID=UPI001396208C|nr:protein slender lobes isoform X1 [Drosophila virilis]